MPEGRHAPGPPALPVLGHLPLVWRMDRLYGHVQLFDRYGDVVRLRMGKSTSHLIRHPDHLRHVLTDRVASYPRGGRTVERMKLFVGNGLVVSEGPFWRRQRRLMQPAFNPRSLHAFVPAMVRATARLLDEWEAQALRGELVCVSDAMTKLTLSIVGETLFSKDLGARASEIGDALVTVQKDVERRLGSVVELPRHVPTPNNKRFQKSVATLDRLVFALLGDRKRAGSVPDDLLARLMGARDENGQAMTDRELRDEIVSLVIAGHETSANTLSLLLGTLGEHPWAYRRLQDEASAVLGGRAPDERDLEKLPWTRAVVDEGLRLYPAVWLFSRRAAEDDVLGGFAIPARSIVTVSPFAVHRHPEFWPQPEAFDPSRFEPAQASGRPRLAYVPFGRGPHMCIGAGFAVLEMRIILAMLAARFDMAAVAAAPAPEALISLRPRRPIFMRLVPRRAS